MKSSTYTNQTVVISKSDFPNKMIVSQSIFIDAAVECIWRSSHFRMAIRQKLEDTLKSIAIDQGSSVEEEDDEGGGQQVGWLFMANFGIKSRPKSLQSKCIISLVTKSPEERTFWPKML